VAKLSYEAATEENAKRRSFMPGPKLPVRRTYQALLAKSTNMIFYEVQNRRISVGNVLTISNRESPGVRAPTVQRT